MFVKEKGGEREGGAAPSGGKCSEVLEKLHQRGMHEEFREQKREGRKPFQKMVMEFDRQKDRSVKHFRHSHQGDLLHCVVANFFAGETWQPASWSA